MKKVLSVFLALIFVFSCIPLTLGVTAETNVVYVASNGNDTSGNGSQGAPYLTFEKAVEANPTGDLEVRIVDSANLSVDASYQRSDSSVIIISSADASNPATLSVGKGFGGGNTQRAFQFNSRVIFKNINVSGGGQYPDFAGDAQYTTVLCINAGAEFIDSQVTVPLGVNSATANKPIVLDSSSIGTLRFGNQVWSSSGGTYEITANQAVVLKNGSSISSLALACASWAGDRSSVKLSGDLTIFADNSTVAAIRNTNSGSKTAEITGNLNVITVGTATVADHTLTSVGSVKKYNITVNGGTADVVLNANTFVGFDFVGTNKDYAPVVAGQFISKNSSGAYAVPEGNVAVSFANLTNPVTVSFSAGIGATGNMDSVLTNAGSYIPLPECNFTNPSKVFVCYTDGDTYYVPGQMFAVPASGATLTALWGDVAYVSANGNDSNSGLASNAAKLTLDAAIRTLTGDGVVYVSGNVSGFEVTTTARGLVRISGLNNSASENIVSFKASDLYGDTIFSNITLNATTNMTSYNSAKINGNKIVIGTGTALTGHSFVSANGGEFTLSSDTTLSMLGAWITYGGVSPDAVAKDTVINLNNGTVGTLNLLGGAYQGNINWGYLTRHGDLTLNINGGSFGTLLLGAQGHSGSTAGKLYGNIIVNMLGGSFGGKTILYGYDAASNRDSYNIVGNSAVIINTKDILENLGSLAGLEIKDAAFVSENRGENILVINNAETDNGIIIENASTLDRLVRVIGGKAVPVFEDTPNSTSNTTAGALLGFRLEADNAGFDAYLGTEKLVANQDGYYVLPEGEVTVVFAKDTYTASFEGANGESGSTPSVLVDTKTPTLILPKCTFTKDGYEFVGWINLEDSTGKILVVGEKVTISGNAIFIPTWKKAGSANVLYVSADGNDANNGLSKSAPLKNVLRALSLYPTGNLEIVLLSDITVNKDGVYECVPARADGSKVIFHGDGDEKKIITIDGGGSGDVRNWNIFCEVEFNNVAFRSSKNAGKYRNLLALNKSNATFINSEIVIGLAMGEGMASGVSVPAEANPTVTFVNSYANELILGMSGWTSPSEVYSTFTGNVTVRATDNSTIETVAVQNTGYDSNEGSSRIVGDLNLIAGRDSKIENLRTNTVSGKQDSVTGNINFISFNGGTLPASHTVPCAATVKYYFEGYESAVAPATKDGRFAGFEVVCENGKIAQIAYDDVAKLYKAGVYNLPANKTITVYTAEGKNTNDNLSLHLNGGKAVGSIAAISDENVLTFPSSPDKQNGYFIGWYLDPEFSVPFTSGTAITGKLDLYAKWGSIEMDPASNSTPNAFYIRGFQVRQQDSKVGQGLRFITRLDKTNIFASLAQINANNANMTPAKNKEIGYGTVVMTSEYLGENELRLGGTYAYDGKTYSAEDVPAYNTFDASGSMLEYTVVLVKMPVDAYKVGFTVRPYIQYYTTSGSIATVYGEPYSTSLFDAASYIYSYGNEDASAYNYLNANILSHFINGVTLTSKPFKDEIEATYNTLKNSILNAPNITPSGTVYYVSVQGNDSNNGKSTSSAWKTLSKVQQALNDGTIAAGSTILFRRGDVFRGTLTLTQHNLTLSAYGTGKKPMIIGSPKNLAEVNWTKTEYENVWVADGTYYNIGNIVFDASLTDYAEIEETHGWMLPYGYGYYRKEDTLASDLQFYSNLDTNDANYGKLYLYSVENPAERFDSIEVAPHGHLIAVNNRTGITISNLEFRYGGSHGVATGNAYNLTVENCVFAYIGGSVHGGHNVQTLFGNAVEAYGQTDGFNVRNNWMYQIYDAAITEQGSGATRLYDNTNWTDNIIEHTHWPFEIWNFGANNSTNLGTIRNLNIEGNFVRNTGAGFGSFTRRNLATVCHMYGFPDTTVDCYVRNNIFDRTTGRFAGLSTAGSKKVVYSGNTYIAENGKDTLSDNNGEYGFTYDTKAETLKTILGDTTAKIYFYN